MLPKAAYATDVSKYVVHFETTITHLAGTVGTSTTDTRNTGDGTTSTPGLSGGLVASLLAHGVRLPLVLGDAL